MSQGRKEIGRRFRFEISDASRSAGASHAAARSPSDHSDIDITSSVRVIVRRGSAKRRISNSAEKFMAARRGAARPAPSTALPELAIDASCPTTNDQRKERERERAFPPPFSSTRTDFCTRCVFGSRRDLWWPGIRRDLDVHLI